MRKDIGKDTQFFAERRKMFIVKNDAGTERLQPAGEQISDLKLDTETTLGFYQLNTSTYKWDSINPGAAVSGDFQIYWNAGTMPDAEGNPTTDVEIDNFDTLNIDDIVVTKKVYGAGQSQIEHIGYTTTANKSGVLGYTTVEAGDELILRIYDRSLASLPYDATLPFQITANTLESQDDDVYSMLSRMAALVSDNNSEHYAPNGYKRLFHAEVIADLTSFTTNFGNSATATVTQGSTAVTTSAAHTITENQYISFNGVIYQAIAVPTTTTITLDRPYSAASATIANANTRDIGNTAPTSLGLSVTSENVGVAFEVATEGEWAGATHTTNQLYALESNSISELQKMEVMSKIRSGYLDANAQATRYYAEPNTFIDPTKFYTVYFINDKRRRTDPEIKYRTKLSIAVEQDNATTANTSLDTFFGL